MKRDNIKIEFKQNSVEIIEKTSADPSHSADLQPHPEEQIAYITEVPLPVGKKTGMMRQMLSGMEKMIAIVRSTLYKALSWIRNKIKAPAEELV